MLNLYYLTSTQYIYSIIYYYRIGGPRIRLEDHKIRVRTNYYQIVHEYENWYYDDSDLRLYRLFLSVAMAIRRDLKEYWQTYESVLMATVNYLPFIYRSITRVGWLRNCYLGLVWIGRNERTKDIILISFVKAMV